MVNDENQVECPNCGHEIDVNSLLYRKVNSELQKEFNEKLIVERNKYEEQKESLDKERSALTEERKQFQEQLQTAIDTKLKSEKSKLEKELKEKIQEDQSEQFKMLQDELNEKSTQLKEFNKAKSEIERLKREKDEMKDQIEAESEKKLNEQLSKQKEIARKEAEQKSQMRIFEKDKVIEQLNEQLKEAQRKAEQGSMQIQGEVQELAIEDWLNKQFPLDEIEEIKKGQRGGDCIQFVNTPFSQSCGSIYYESKRTKGFQASWIEKFKEDIRDRNADIGVLVTETMPNDMQRAGQKEGIWICTFEEFKILSVALRETIIRLNESVVNQENKGEKMNMLYDFLTSTEFKLQIEGIVEGFTQLQVELESEKRSMMSIWKRREKQLQKVLENTNFMYSSFKGIAGNAIQSVQMLELSHNEG